MVSRVCESVLAAAGIRTTLGPLCLATNGRAANADGAPGAFLLMPIPTAMFGSPFFALGTMIFSYLMLRSRIIPAPLAALGVIASLLLVAGVPLQLAGFLKSPVAAWIWIPMFLFQFLLGLWLLIKGDATPAPRQNQILISTK